MKSWQAILISGALIAGAIIIRAEPISSAFAASTYDNMTDDVAACVLQAAYKGAGYGEFGFVIFNACVQLDE
jgi:hypothetical protein